LFAVTHAPDFATSIYDVHAALDGGNADELTIPWEADRNYLPVLNALLTLKWKAM